MEHQIRFKKLAINLNMLGGELHKVGFFANLLIFHFWGWQARQPSEVNFLNSIGKAY